MATERRFLVPINLVKNELRNAVLQVLASAPSSPAQGQMYYDSTLNIPRIWSGTAWLSLEGAVTDVSAVDGTLTITPTTGSVTAKVAKALDHTYITDFDTQVRTSRLDQMGAPTAPVSANSQKITSLADGTAATDAATKGQMDLAVQGLAPKGSAAAATTAALAANTYANGTAGVGATLTANANGAMATIDGYAPAVGDVILVKNEATASHNGLYTVTQLGDGSHPYILTRATNNDAANEIAGGYVFVLNGTTNANQGWVVDSVGPYTMGTTSITWTQFTGVADITNGGGISKSGNTLTANTRSYAATITGDGSTTTFNVSHNLGSTDTVVQVLDPASSPVNQRVEVDTYAVDANTTRIIFGVAPANLATYRVVTIACIVNG